MSVTLIQNTLQVLDVFNGRTQRLHLGKLLVSWCGRNVLA